MVRIKGGVVSFNVDDPVPEDDEIYGPPIAGYRTICSTGRDDDGVGKRERETCHRREPCKEERVIPPGTFSGKENAWKADEP